LFNPLDSSLGLKPMRMQNDVIIYSQVPDKNVQKENAFVITSPGEYEIGGIFIYGLLKNGGLGDNTIFILEYEGLRLAHLGNLQQTKFNDSQLEKLQGIDVLIVPVGGGDALDAKQAVEITSQLEPRVVIPVNYDLPGLKIKLDSVDKFKKEIGASFEKLDKLKVVKKDLLEEDTRFVLLEAT